MIIVAPQERALVALRSRMAASSSADGAGTQSSSKRPRNRRELQEAMEDAALLTLNSLLHTMAGTMLTIDRCDDTVLHGCLVRADNFMNLELANVKELRSYDPGSVVARHDRLSVKASIIRSIHLPQEMDTPELMISRLRAIDRGRNHFNRRVKMKAPKARQERLAPIVSANVTEADAFGTQAELT
mmetsp:Transcript_35475/g.93106  ORF Transcript_35475/g.93106 Transcript_35475/m.93106 type:complete len:186 (-) Transcript_35475:366-923(-)